MGTDCVKHQGRTQALMPCLLLDYFRVRSLLALQPAPGSQVQKATPWLCRVGEHDDATAVAQQAAECASADGRPAAWLATRAAAMGCHTDAAAWLDRAAEVKRHQNCQADRDIRPDW